MICFVFYRLALEVAHVKLVTEDCSSFMLEHKMRVRNGNFSVLC